MMNRMHLGKQVLFGMVSFWAYAFAGAATLSDATLVRMGPMGVEPTVDGEISPVEMARTSPNYGLVSRETNLMATRGNAAFLGWTEKGVYCAIRSSKPPQAMGFGEADQVALVLQPPDGEAQEFRVALRDGSRMGRADFEAATKPRKGVQDYGYGCVETEIFVPFAALDVAKVADGETWGAQILLDYSSKAETACWHPTDDSELGTFIPDRTMPVTGLKDFDPLESWRNSGNCKLRYCHYNPTDGTCEITSKTVLHHGIGYSKLDANPEESEGVNHRQLWEVGAKLEPGETLERIPIAYNLWAGTVNILESQFLCRGKVIYRRKLSWDVGKGLGWKEPEPLPHVYAGFYPTVGNRLRTGYTCWGVSQPVRAVISVIGPGGKVYWSRTFKGNPNLPGADFIPDVGLGELPLGDYIVRLELDTAAGRRYRDEKTFSVASFKWQKMRLGLDRVVIPPYTPIRVEKRGGQWTKVSFVQTGYRSKGILWDEVYAKGENILAAPVELKLNGQSFKAMNDRLVEKSPDRVVREVSAKADGVALTVTQDYDYDGFCLATFSFDVAGPLKVRTLQLTVPVRDKIVSLFDVINRNDRRAGPAPDFTIPKGTGEIWNSAVNVRPGHGNLPTAIQPYIWIGGPEKGFSWIAESWKNWSLDSEVPAERMIREKGVLTLVCDIVNKEVLWKPGTYVIRMGFMPSPAKPQNKAHYREAESMWDYACPSNAVRFGRGCCAMCSSLNGPMHVYPGRDLSYPLWALSTKSRSPQELKDHIDAYLAKNRDWFRTSKSTTYEDYKSGLPSWIRWMGGVNLFYLNPELNTCMWPEWEMYKAEWHCEAWPRENMIHEYLGRPSPSRIDKLLFDGYKALRLGHRGIYYDCFVPSGDWNYLSLTNGAFTVDNVNSYHTPMQSLSCGLAWRELMKRTAIMCYKSGGLLAGQPLVELHTTESHLVPVSSWCSNNLCTERGGDGGDFQDRFPEGYTLAEITGGQSGAVPKIIVSTRAGDTERRVRETESMMGYMCAYGVFGLTDQGVLRGQKRFARAWNAVFDYGWGRENVTHHFYYDGKPQPVRHNGRDIRVTVAEKKGESALLMFGNLGDATEFTFDASRLGLDRNAKLTDAETGLPLAQPKLAIARHGYRLVLVSK